MGTETVNEAKMLPMQILFYITTAQCEIFTNNENKMS